MQDAADPDCEQQADPDCETSHSLTPDTRALQVLSPVLTVQQVHSKLWVSQNGGAGQASTTNTTFSGGIRAKAGISRQTSARSGRSARSLRSAATSAGARPSTRLSGRLEVPAYVNPTLWAAALQQEAMFGSGQLGVQSSKVAEVQKLQEGMLQELQQYKQLQPELEVHQPSHPYLRPVHKPAPSFNLNQRQQQQQQQEASTTAATAGQSTNLASPHPSQQPLSCPGSMAWLPQSQLANLTSRLEAACQLVVQDLPAHVQDDAAGAGAAHTPNNTSTRRAPATGRTIRMQVHTHKPAAPATGLEAGARTRRAQGSSHACDTAQQLQQPSGSMQSSSGSLRPPMLLVDKSCCQLDVNSSPSACTTGTGATLGAAPSTLHCSSTLHSMCGEQVPAQLTAHNQQQHDHHHHQQEHHQQQQQQQLSPHEGLQCLQPPDYAGIPFKLQHLRLKVAPDGSPSSSPRSGCSPKSHTNRSGKGPASSLMGLSKLQVVQASLPPGAVEALQAAAATAVAQQLHRYHAHLTDAQQHLLLAAATPEPPVEQQQQHPGTEGDHADAGAYEGAVSTSGKASSTPAGSKSDAKTAAQMTVQELVRRLAKQDVQPDQEEQAPAGSHEAPSSHTAAVNQRLLAATSLSELIDAANEHLRVSSLEPGIKLDIGRIARLQRMGKQWLSESSARSAASGGGGSGRAQPSSGTAPMFPQAAGLSVISSNRSTSSTCSSTVASARVVKPVVPQPIRPGTMPVMAAGTAAHAAAARHSTTAEPDEPSAAGTSALMSTSTRNMPSMPAAAAQRQVPTAAAGSLGSHTSAEPSSMLSMQHAAGSSTSSSRHPTSAAEASLIASSTTTATQAAALQPDRLSSSDSGSSSSNTTGSSKGPAPMKLQVPVLRHPTEAEVAALPLPSLPQLLDLSHEPVKVLQARLERVWDALGIPAEQQLDMVLRHTTRSAAALFDAVLEAWEAAAAAVLQREAILEQLLQLQGALSHCRRQQQQQQQRQQQRRCSLQPSGSVTSVGEAESTLSLSGTQSCLLGLTVQQVQQLLWAFLAATQQVQLTAEALVVVTGQELLVDGCAYPPANVTDAQLQNMLTEACKLLGG